MGKFIPVVKENLKDKFWKRPENMSFAKSAVIIPVALREVARLLLFLPIAFHKVGENYRPVALLNLVPQNGNLFVNQKGIWIGRYMPLFFSAYPFTLRFTEDKKIVLLVDEDFIVNDSGTPFFKENGELSDEVNKIIKFLLERERDYQLSSQICNKIAEMDILEPWELKINNQKTSIKDLYRINLNKYTELEDEKVLELRRSGAFILIYAHLFSLTNIDSLANLLKLLTAQKQNKK